MDSPEVGPLSSVPGDVMRDHEVDLPNFRMTVHGRRQLVGKKKVRGKPLVKLTCCGCDRTTFDNCRWIEGDWIESYPQLFKSFVFDSGI